MYYDELISKHKKDIKLCILIFLVYVCIYGFMSLRLGMAGEEVLAIAGEPDDIYRAGGRWGHSLYRQLTYLGTVPYGAGIVAGLYISIALIIQTKILKFTGTWAPVIYSILYLCCLQWIYQLRYSNQSDSLGLAILFITVAVYLLQEKGWIRTLASVVLITLAISVYQSLLIYAVTLMLIKGIHQAIHERTLHFTSWFLKSSGIIISSFVLYLIGSYVSVTYSNIPPDTLEYVLNYRAEATGYKAALASDTPIWQTFFLNAKNSLLHNYLITGYKSHWIMFSVLVACSIVLIKIAMDKRKWPQKLLYAAMVCALMIMPYSTSILMLEHQGIRVQVAEPLLLAGIWGLTIPYITQNNWIKAQHAISIMTVSFFLEAIYTSSDIAGNEAYAFDRAREEVLDMYALGQAVAEREHLGECRIVVLGASPIIPGEHLNFLRKQGLQTGCASPYIFSKGYAWAQAFINYMRLPRMEKGIKKDIEFHKEVYDTMRAWPHPSSVKASRGEVIIRLTPTPDDRKKLQKVYNVVDFNRD